jgi:hypothetical protein
MTVHSIFASAVNLDGPDGLLTIAREGIGGLPNGILVAGDPDLAASGLRRGMSVEMDEAHLVVPDAAVVVDLRPAVRWSPTLARAGSDAAARWRGRSRLVHAVSARLTVSGGLSAVSSATDHLARLAWAVEGGDRDAAARAARALIGRGPGLTPSGDDAIAGVEAALHALGHPLAGVTAACLDDIDERTTTVSAALLRHAARGAFAERIHDLLAALLAPAPEHTAAGDPPWEMTLAHAPSRSRALTPRPTDADLSREIVDGIATAVAWGATSGSDCLAGVLIGLDAATGVTGASGDLARRRVA